MSHWETPRYWDEVADVWRERRPQLVWRRYCDELNADLVARYASGLRVSRALKTDLFDEAIGDGDLYQRIRQHAHQVVGIDLSKVTAHRATAELPELLTSAADVRHLPFRDGSFDLVLSNSTLDHFRATSQIQTALAELYRVLRIGGALILTLDNMANPLIALRRALPHSLLSAIRITPYYVGATCGPRTLCRWVTGVGFDIVHLETMMHCPRILAVYRANRLGRHGSPEARQRYLKRLAKWERLGRLPTRFLTGYFLTVLAVRSGDTATDLGSAS